MSLQKTVSDIKSLRIQGAAAVARQGLQALTNVVKQSKKKDKQLLSEMKYAYKKLISARSTEPMLRNILKRVITESKGKDKKEILSICKTQQAELKKVKIDLIKHASKRISKSKIVFTHCHSSSVTSSIIAAKKRNVFCTETRPLYQGHKTARELSSAGIRTTMTVDSACRGTIKQCDLVLLGADAITYGGAVINKIGSAMIASIASEFKKPLIIVASSLKFDPETRNKDEPIEQRDPREVLRKPIRGVKVLNPAFEAIHPDKISYIITEFGPIRSKNIAKYLKKKRPWMFK